MKLIAASCANVRDVDPQPVWDEIRAEAPDVLLLLGDNVYLPRNDHQDAAALAAELRGLYEQQLREPAFAALRADLAARGGRLIALYDDHDFIGNDRGGADHPAALRLAARAEFVRAFAPATTGDDIYAVHALGLVDLIVLDGRFYRSSAHKPASALAATDAVDALLGPVQWRWLEAAVQASRAPYLLIASATTLHAFGDESWESYPAAFARLVTLLRGRRGALVLSGDVHRNAAYDESGVIEIVSSGVAHRGLTFGRLRRNYGVFTFTAEHVHVDLRSLKVGNRFAFEIPLARWALP